MLERVIFLTCEDCGSCTTGSYSSIGPRCARDATIEMKKSHKGKSNTRTTSGNSSRNDKSNEKNSYHRRQRRPHAQSSGTLGILGKSNQGKKNRYSESRRELAAATIPLPTCHICGITLQFINCSKSFKGSCHGNFFVY